MNEELLTFIVKLVLALLSVIITSYVIPWLKAKIESTKYNDLMIFIEKFVESAEKIYTPEQWRDKKSYVLRLAEEYAQSHNVDITAPELNALIEGWVKEVKG